MARLYDPDDPIVEMIKARNPDATEVEVFLLLHEWWLLYGEGFIELGSLAQVALGALGEKTPEVVANGMAQVLADAGVESMGLIVLAALDEVNNRLCAVLDTEVVEEAPLRELLEYLMKLGRVG